MTTTWLLICPTPLELMLPVMPLSQPMANSPLHLDSGSVVCARAVPVAPSPMAMMAATAARLIGVGVMSAPQRGRWVSCRSRALDYCDSCRDDQQYRRH